jgi:ATPase subunit of ABC transporter with duplicated ATPase domains
VILIDAQGLKASRPNRPLFDNISLTLSDGDRIGVVGLNGCGKSTLLRILSGDYAPDSGVVRYGRGARIGILAQQPALPSGSVRDAVSADWRGEAMLDRLGMSGLIDAQTNELSGGQQKRLALEALLRGPDEVLMLDEPDNYLDVPGKLWLEQQIKESPKTILLISHDRALLNEVADRIITVEDGRVWVHGGSFASYHEARKARYERQEEILRRWTEEHDRLKELVRTLQGQAKSSPDMASKYRAMQTRLRKFEEQGAPEAPPQDQNIKMTLRGSRTGVRVVTCEQVQIDGLLKPFDFEIFFGDRVAVLGPNGAGKSHLLRLFAETEADEIRVGKPWSGKKKIGARVVPGHFAQTHAHPDWVNRTPVEIINTVKPMLLNESIGILRKYELSKQSDQKFQTLSGGQQARLQILVLELAGCNLLLLDEPTDNLDLASAQALQDALDAFQGTVIAVTHDRWFADSFDRYLYVGADGVVRETTAPLWA